MDSESKLFAMVINRPQKSPLARKVEYYSGILTFVIKQTYFGLRQGLHMIEKFLNKEVFLEKSLRIKSDFKSAGKLP